MENMYIEELKSSVNLLMANLESMPVSKGGEFKLQKLKRSHNASIIDLGEESENQLSKSDVVLAFSLEVRRSKPVRVPPALPAGHGGQRRHKQRVLFLAPQGPFLNSPLAERGSANQQLSPCPASHTFLKEVQSSGLNSGLHSLHCRKAVTKDFVKTCAI